MIDCKAVAEETAKYLADALGNRVVQNHLEVPKSHGEAEKQGWECLYIACEECGDVDSINVKSMQHGHLFGLKEYMGDGFLAFSPVPPKDRNGAVATSQFVSARCIRFKDDTGAPCFAIDVFVMTNNKVHDA